jgi:transcriptional regulator with XRE-family HTH domain
VLRTGQRINPSLKYLHGLCAFFGVPIDYFFDDGVAAGMNAQLEVAASLRKPAVRQLATRAADLSDEALETLGHMVEHARKLEGLESRPFEAGAPTANEPAIHPRRRGRRPRPRGRGTTV